MSISKRLIDLARAELNSLLDRAAARAGDGDDDDREFRRSRDDGEFAGMSDDELAAEIERRRLAREEVDEAARRQTAPAPRRRPDDRPRRAPPRATTRSGGRTPRWRSRPVRTSRPCASRTAGLMRKYHPDLHGGTPEKSRAATEPRSG